MCYEVEVFDIIFNQERKLAMVLSPAVGRFFFPDIPP